MKKQGDVSLFSFFSFFEGSKCELPDLRFMKSHNDTEND